MQLAIGLETGYLRAELVGRRSAQAFAHEPPAVHWLRGAADRRYRFSRVVIAGAPAEPGVSRLVEQLAAGVPATHDGWEISREPAARELELLQQFRQAFGRLPRLNEAA